MRDPVNEPAAEQEPMLTDPIADAWAAVVINLYEKGLRKQTEKEKQTNIKPAAS